LFSKIQTPDIGLSVAALILLPKSIEKNKMEQETLKPFFVIGISVRTSNENGQAANDIPALWNRFRSEDIGARLNNKTGDEVYSIYTDYEGDYTRPYTTILGYAVENLEHIPEGMRGLAIEGGPYEKHSLKGNLLQGLVYNGWVDIWSSGISRAYTVDFEAYGAAAQNPEDAEVDIFIATR
jgi:predicted transcriptional regulator YdeE